jgi:hypothetical protein
MKPTLLLLLLLVQAEGPDPFPLGEVPGALPAATAGGWHSLMRLEASGLALLPRGGGGGVERYVRPGALASLGLGADNAR